MLISCCGHTSRLLTELYENQRGHFTLLLQSLLWLVFKVIFKMMLLVYKALQGRAPDYLSEMPLVSEAEGPSNPSPL